jgi:hypothetical protein
LERKCTALAEGVANRWVVGVWVCVNTYWGAVSTSINETCVSGAKSSSVLGCM